MEYFGNKDEEDFNELFEHADDALSIIKVLDSALTSCHKNDDPFIHGILLMTRKLNSQIESMINIADITQMKIELGNYKPSDFDDD